MCALTRDARPQVLLLDHADKSGENPESRAAVAAISPSALRTGSFISSNPHFHKIRARSLHAT